MAWLPSSRTSMMATVGSPAAAASWAARRMLEREAAERRWSVPIVAMVVVSPGFRCPAIALFVSCLNSPRLQLSSRVFVGVSNNA